MSNLKAAQRAIYEGGNRLVDAGLHLQGTIYEKSFDRMYKALNALNRKLIKAINK